MIYFTIFLIFVINNQTHGAIDVEKYFKICGRSSPDVEECLKEAIADGLKKTSKGIPELRVPPTDPYYRKDVLIEYNVNQITAKGILSDVLVSGITNSKIRNVRLKADEDKFHLEVNMFTPLIQVNGKYRVVAEIGAVVLLNTSGEFKVNMSDATYTWQVVGKPETVHGEVFVRITNFYMSPDITDMKVIATNDNPQYSEIFQLGFKFVYDNWRLLYQEFLPFSRKNWEEMAIRVANRIFLKVPYERLFPSDY